MSGNKRSAAPEPPESDEPLILSDQPTLDSFPLTFMSSLLLTLPDDLLIAILINLNVQDLVSIQQVGFQVAISLTTS